MIHNIERIGEDEEVGYVIEFTRDGAYHRVLAPPEWAEIITQSNNEIVEGYEARWKYTPFYYIALVNTIVHIMLAWATGRSTLFSWGVTLAFLVGSVLALHYAEFVLYAAIVRMGERIKKLNFSDLLPPAKQ